LKIGEDRKHAMKPLRWIWITTIIASSALLAGCTKTDKPYNLVLITVDTLRPDRLGYGGNPRDTSPVIDRLAAEGVVFTNSYSQSGWTLPSIATIFTGHYPKDHGATDFHWSLDVKLPTLAGILRRNGYDTKGYVSHVMLTPTYGVADGFASYDYSVLDVGDPHDVSTARELTDLAVVGVKRATKPYFLWVHYFDPHFEYLSHPAFASFGNSDIDRYDGEIAHTDYYIGKLLHNLPDKDHTVIVFTSDHGEEFGEHGGVFHYTLHQEVMRVPLVIKAPFLEPRMDDSINDQTDLLPTMLGLLGIEPPEGLPGRDLFGPPPAEWRPIYIERDRPPPWRQRGMIEDGMKLVFIEEVDSTLIPPASRGTHVPVTNVHPGTYLFDLSKDPGEMHNVFNASDTRALELLGRMMTHFSQRKYEEAGVEVDQELLEKLRSLGYVK
jgi:arylsulfatase A-like enzyme